MKALLHRLLVSFTGMPDEPLRGCTGNCDQGRCICDCELSLDVPPDDKRVIAPPARTPEDDAYRVAALRWAAAVGAALWLSLAALLRLMGAESIR